MYSRVFGDGDFKYAIQNFKLVKGVAMATKFGQKRAKIEQKILSRSHRSSNNVVKGSQDVFPWILVPFIGLIKIFQQLDYFSQKRRKLPISAMVKIRQTFK